MLKSVVAAAVLLSLTAAVPGAAQAQDGAVPFSCPAPGTKLTTSNGNTLTFRERAGLVCNFETAAGKSAYLAGVLTTNSTTAVTNSRHYDELWPAVKGKKIVFQSGTTAAWERSYTVTAIEKIKVPAGEFEVVKIVGTQDGVRDNHHSSRSTFWWAPSVGYLVKYEYELLRGNNSNPPRNWEATAIVRP